MEKEQRPWSLPLCNGHFFYTFTHSKTESCGTFKELLLWAREITQSSTGTLSSNLHTAGRGSYVSNALIERLELRLENLRHSSQEETKERPSSLPLGGK